jgi:hypothetical protein
MFIPEGNHVLSVCGLTAAEEKNNRNRERKNRIKQIPV